MERRQYVAALGSVLATGFAGCPGNGNGNGSDETPTPTRREGSSNPEDWVETFRSALLEEEIDVDFVDANEEWIVLDYVTETTEVTEFFREMETVATTYGEVVGTNWDVQGAELWVLDPEIDNPREEALASTLVRNEWALSWQVNEMTTDQLMENVLDTGERYRPYYDRYVDEDMEETPSTPPDRNGTTTDTGDNTSTATANATDTTDSG